MATLISHSDAPPMRPGPPVPTADVPGSPIGPGQRLNTVFEELVDWLVAYRSPVQLAVDADEVSLTYAELDTRANQLARYLLDRGARPGDRVGLLFDRPAQSYIGMLAVLKINAAYVPLDVGFPTDRLGFIVSDARVRFVLSTSHVRERVEMPAAPEPVYVDEAADAIARLDRARLSDAERGAPVDDLAYVIYTSGTTGRPKGVAIEHASICNFVRVAAEVYGIQANDRVYQGMTIAFDFSVEEIWVPWMAGATLVPKPAGPSLIGWDLHRYLTRRRVTAMCAVPTLLATIEDDLPQLRFLLVSGEACPQDLVTRWHRPGRRFLNVYGPTETTVTATWTVLSPDRPVTIGRPLPTYSVVVLDPEDPGRVLPLGEPGELGIAGIGLARGYLNRDDLTDKAFVPDPLGLADNPSGRIYRTGDLARINTDGEIEYLGRIDRQVKIRGYRIELTEIESVLLRIPGIAAAVVDTFEPTPGGTELVGYYSPRAGADEPDPQAIYAQLREQLPGYMVPAYLQRLDRIPLTTSDKLDRAALPAPTVHRGGDTSDYIAPANHTERLLAEALADVLGIDKVSTHSHFFDDLNANSLLMAHYSAQIRRQSALGTPSIRDIYQNPTVHQLAEVLTTAPHTQAPVGGPHPDPPVLVRTSSAKYLATGAAQLVCLLGAIYLIALLVDFGFSWSLAAITPWWVFLRSTAFTAALLLATCLLPILAKWLLIGRFKQREINLWSLAYLRFWIVRTLLALNPLQLFTGSPIYPLYLRALGAKIGKGATILAAAPVATDLISIGAGTLIRQGSTLTGYHATNGKLRFGPVRLGDNVFIGQASVLDIHTSIGDRAQLGHNSTLHSGQHIPAGQRWHGTPAEPTTTDYHTVAPIRLGRPRRFLFGAALLLATAILAPATTGLATLLATVPTVSTYFDPATLQPASARFWVWMLAISAAGFLGFTLLALAANLLVPRLLQPIIRPGRTYRLYGAHHIVASLIMQVSNSRFFTQLFGDSSAAVGYTKALGYDLGEVQQTGSNFGTEFTQDSAPLTSVGRGTMISDGMAIANTDYSNSSFKMSHIALGERTFIGNNLVVPAGARIGANVLLATKVMVPIDGPLRENVGLLGSPPIQIPRSVARDTRFDHLKTPEELPRRLRAKLHHNLGSMATLLLLGWIRLLAAAALMTLAINQYPRLGYPALALGLLTVLMFNILLAAFAERAVLRFHRLTPRFVSIYDPYFWRHERLWKVLTAPTPLFNGTPFRTLNWRLLGVKVGKRLYDDGAGIPEKTLATLGDDVILNAGAVIQCHSLEDSTFKSDYTALGDGVVLRPQAFAHYGVNMATGTVLDANAFLMKGTQTTPFSHWGGNPATEIRERNHR